MSTLRAGIADFGILCAAGDDRAACLASLQAGRRFAPTMYRAKTTGQMLPVAAVTTPLPTLPAALASFQCRNNAMAAHILAQIQPAIDQCLARFGPTRVAVVVGSSTSGLDETERAHRQRQQNGHLPPGYHFEHQHAMGSLASFIAQATGALGPAYTHSTACASSARAMLSAAALLHADVADAVITGGIDTLCDLTVNGFHALGALSDAPMNPLSAHRTGLNIGEGGALFVLTRDEAPLVLLGGGESMDAHHMSAPDPTGLGARLAMERALQSAGLAASDIAYINLHGTATPANDAMETLAVRDLQSAAPISSTKPMTGHCLGAAGAVEAALCCLAIAAPNPAMPPHIYDGAYDPALPPLHVVSAGERFSGRYILSNSFAFGGSNCALVLGSEVAS